MKRLFYVLMAVATMFFVGCTDKNAPDSGSEENYVGTWIPQKELLEPFSYSGEKILCVQLNADMSCFVVEELTKGDHVFNLPQGAIIGYKGKWNLSKEGNKTYLNMSGSAINTPGISVNGFAFEDVEVLKIDKENLSVVVYEGMTADFKRTSDATMENYLNNLVTYQRQ